MIPFLDMKSQFRLIEAEIRAALDEVLASSRYVLGRQLAAFEQEFAAYIGVEYAVGVGSGTDAIHLALRAVGVGPGDEVVTAANTCVPTVAGIWAAGATPVLVDVDPTTLTMAPSTLDAAMTERTKAIVPVHLYGHPCDMAAIMAIAERRGVELSTDPEQDRAEELARALLEPASVQETVAWLSRKRPLPGSASVVLLENVHWTDALAPVGPVGPVLPVSPSAP